ncbi:MAG: capsular biosynthesis protein [Bacillota bacterium]|nr:MAG: capsular biosynthesis protein [Bacillota bacterium]
MGGHPTRRLCRFLRPRPSRVAAALLVALAAAWLAACGGIPVPDTGPGSGSDDEEGSRPSPPPPPPRRATLLSVGDIFLHDSLLQAGRDPATGNYDFRPFLDPVRDTIRTADLAVANLETPVAGKAAGYSGYPLFNAPDALLEALRDAGFDVLTNANNHSLDRGARGLIRTYESLDRFGFVHTGTARSPAERDRVAMVEVNGVRIAFTAYTYGTNGIPLPEPHMVNLIDEERIAADVARARQAGADLVSVSLHFGNEYQPEPSPEQERLVEAALDSGADIILGHHPHVLQRAELRDGKAVLFSQGNFLCGQIGEDRMTSALFWLDIEKDVTTGRAAVTGIRFEPVYIHKARIAGRLVWRPLPAAAAARDPARYGVPPGDVPVLERAFRRAVERLEAPGVQLNGSREAVASRQAL